MKRRKSLRIRVKRSLGKERYLLLTNEKGKIVIDKRRIYKTTRKLHTFEDDHIWIEENREILLRQYPEQWIAVKNKQVIASDPDFDGLLSKLKDPADTAVEFITREPLGMIL